MLTIVLSDAWEEVDVCRHYPAFYRRLLASAELRRQFLDALAVLAAYRAGTLAEGKVDTRGLDFLHG